eukprot:scaffold3302_cov146-Skeletonema_menzelii.AAC.8
MTLAGVEVVDQSQRKRKRSRMRCRDGAFGKFILLHVRDCHWCSDEPKDRDEESASVTASAAPQRLLTAVPTPTTTTGMDAATTATFCCSTSQSEFCSGWDAALELATEEATVSVSEARACS